MIRQTYLVQHRKTGQYIPMSEHIRKLGLNYDTVLARIHRSDSKLKTLAGGRTVIFSDNDPIFSKVKKQ